MSQELQPLGMDVTTKPAQGYSDWNANITGQPSQWQTAIHWGNGGNIPYIQFQNWLDSTDANSVAHFQGYSNPAADAALRSYESTDPSDTATLYPIVQTLEKIMSTDVPGRSAALWSRLERLQQREVHRLAQPVAPVHEPVTQRPADALHPHAAQAGFLSFQTVMRRGRRRAGRDITRTRGDRP